MKSRARLVRAKPVSHALSAGLPQSNASSRWPWSWPTPPARAAARDRARRDRSSAAAGLRFGCVLADAGHGLSAPFRQGLSARGLTWAVGVGGRQKVYPVDVAVAGRGRPRQNHVPDAKSISAERILATAPWRTLSWRRGTKGPLKARIAAVRIKVADGPPQRTDDMGQQHLPGEEAWLIGEHRSNGERKYYLSNLPADVTKAPGRRHQGALDLRAGASAIERDSGSITSKDDHGWGCIGTRS